MLPLSSLELQRLRFDLYPRATALFLANVVKIFVHLISFGSPTHHRLEVILTSCTSGVATTVFELYSSATVISMYGIVCQPIVLISPHSNGQLTALIAHRFYCATLFIFFIFSCLTFSFICLGYFQCHECDLPIQFTRVLNVVHMRNMLFLSLLPCPFVSP